MLCVLILSIRYWGNLLSNSGIWCLKTFRAPLVRVGYRWRRSWFLVSISCSSWLNFNISRKYLGSLLFTNLYQNFRHWTSNMSFTFNKFNFLKKGSVSALYLLFVMMRRARFCSFYMRSHSNPQFVIPNWRCMINESYINFMAEKGKYRFSLFITPKVCDFVFVCEFQFIYSFTVNPRKLNSVTHSIMVLFIIRRGISFSVKILRR